MKPSRSSFTHVLVYMTGVAFIPVDTAPPSDLRPPLDNGEVMFDGPETDFSPKFVVYNFPEPVIFDLLNPPTAREIAKFLNKIEVPAGTYHKIRVYYEQVVVDGVVAQRTANGHLDIHFKAENAWDANDVHVDNRGYLVIPVAPDPADGVRLYCVAIRILGLKVNETGSGKIIVRPQVFAELARPVKYSIIGTAENVDHASRSFDIRTLANLFPTFYHALTQWAFDDNVFDPVALEVAVDNMIGIDALRTGAFVEAIGVFNTTATPMTFRADEVFITFPDVRQGTADNVWIIDNTAFIVRSSADNVTVFPSPDRSGAYYDNSTSTFPLTFDAITNGIQVKARGYFNSYPDLDAYWISIGP